MKIALLGPAHLDPLLTRLRLTSEAAQRVPKRIATPVAPLAESLLDRGHEVLLVTLHSDVENELVFDGERLRVRVGPSRRRARHRAMDLFDIERRYLLSVLMGEEYDIVHAHWTYEYALAALRAPRPSIVTVRDWAPTVLRMNPHPYRAVRLLMNARVLRSAPHLTVASPYMKKKVERWVRRPVTLVPNSVPDAAFQCRNRPPRLDAPVLLAVNNGFQRRKNVAALLSAFSAVREWNRECRLWLIGHGYGPGGEAHSWANSRGLAESVRFLGVLPAAQVAKAMQEADLFVHPALEESFGMVLAEAMAKGLPVIGGRKSGAVPWVLNQGAAGVLTDVNAPPAIAKSIIAVLSNRALWLRVSGEGYERAWDTFRSSMVHEGYESVYAQALAEYGK